MKLASALIDGRPAYGLIDSTDLVLPGAAFITRYPSLRAVLAAQETDGLPLACKGGERRPLDTLTLLPPITNPSRVVCVGINYSKKYPLDQSVSRPANIILFAKLPGTLVGHGTPLEVPPGAAAETFDYEGEVALIIGKGGRHIAPEDAHRHVAGYTLFNDGSVRGWQAHSVHAGKNFANSSAMGPWMVTADVLPSPESMELRTQLNGEVVQRTTLSEMFFSIPQIVAYVSSLHPLEPGDVIATGSPDGTGGSQTPPRFLRAGDIVEVSVEGIGRLANAVGPEP